MIQIIYFLQRSKLNTLSCVPEIVFFALNKLNGTELL